MRSQVKAEVLAEFIYDGTKITTAAAVATATAATRTSTMTAPWRHIY
jgi:hypothetical protein